MRDKDRIKPFINKFQKLWLQYPDLRFGQLVTILSEMVEDYNDIFNMEEYQWSEAINQYMERTGIVRGRMLSSIESISLMHGDIHIISDEVLDVVLKPFMNNKTEIAKLDGQELYLSTSEFNKLVKRSKQ